MQAKIHIKDLSFIEIELIFILNPKKYEIFFFIYLNQYQTFPIEYTCAVYTQ